MKRLLAALKDLLTARQFHRSICTLALPMALAAILSSSLQIVDTLMTGFLMILAIAVMMLLEDWRLGLIVIALTPLSILLSSFLSSKSEKHFYTMFTQAGELNSLVEEAFTNFATTKAYNLERYT